MASHSSEYLKEVSTITDLIDPSEIEGLAKELLSVRKTGGRLFFIGLGGSAGNTGHAVNDFRKLCGIEAYSITDNVSELTARANDEGWETIFSGWLKISNLNKDDGIFVFSVGGGDNERNVSIPIIKAIDYAIETGARVFGVIGRDGGYTKKLGTAVIVSPTVMEARVTPHAEEFQSIIWHCLVSNPILQVNATKW